MSNIKNINPNVINSINYSNNIKKTFEKDLKPLNTDNPENNKMTKKNVILLLCEQEKYEYDNNKGYEDVSLYDEGNMDVVKNIKEEKIGKNRKCEVDVEKDNSKNESDNYISTAMSSLSSLSLSLYQNQMIVLDRFRDMYGLPPHHKRAIEGKKVLCNEAERIAKMCNNNNSNNNINNKLNSYISYPFDLGVEISSLSSLKTNEWKKTTMKTALIRDNDDYSCIDNNVNDDIKDINIRTSSNINPILFSQRAMLANFSIGGTTTTFTNMLNRANVNSIFNNKSGNKNIKPTSFSNPSVATSGNAATVATTASGNFNNEGNTNSNVSSNDNNSGSKSTLGALKDAADVAKTLPIQAPNWDSVEQVMDIAVDVAEYITSFNKYATIQNCGLTQKVMDKDKNIENIKNKKRFRDDYGYLQTPFGLFI